MMVPTDVKWQTIKRIIYISLYVHIDKKKHMMDADGYEMANHRKNYIYIYLYIFI